jgi:hypothetical protein
LATVCGEEFFTIWRYSRYLVIAFFIPAGNSVEEAQKQYRRARNRGKRN